MSVCSSPHMINSYHGIYISPYHIDFRLLNLNNLEQSKSKE